MRRRMSALGGKASVTQTPRGFVGTFVCLSTWSKYRPLSGRLRWENTSSASLSELSLPGILIWRGATCFSCYWGFLEGTRQFQPPESLVPRRVDKETGMLVAISSTRIEIEAPHLASLQRHCEPSTLKKFHCATGDPHPGKNFITVVDRGACR